MFKNELIIRLMEHLQCKLLWSSVNTLEQIIFLCEHVHIPLRPMVCVRRNFDSLVGFTHICDIRIHPDADIIVICNYCVLCSYLFSIVHSLHCLAVVIRLIACSLYVYRLLSAQVSIFKSTKWLHLILLYRQIQAKSESEAKGFLWLGLFIHLQTEHQFLLGNSLYNPLQTAEN